MLRQVLDAFVLRDAAIVFGNSVKLAISLASAVYDVILITQHYVLYPCAHPAAGSGLPVLSIDASCVQWDGQRSCEAGSGRTRSGELRGALIHAGRGRSCD